MQEEISGCQAPLGYYIAGMKSHSSFQLDPTSHHHQFSIVTASISAYFPMSLLGQGSLELSLWSSLLTVEEFAAGMKRWCLKKIIVTIIWRMDWKGWVWWPEDQLEDYYSLRSESQQETQSVNTAPASDFMTDWHKIHNRWVSFQCLVIPLCVWCLAPLSDPLAPSHVVSFAFCLRLEVWIYDCSCVDTISPTIKLSIRHVSYIKTSHSQS